MRLSHVAVSGGECVMFAWGVRLGFTMVDLARRVNVRELARITV
jgi:hypothetical protein